MARSSTISAKLKKRAAQIKLILMDVDGTMTDGGVTLLSLLPFLIERLLLRYRHPHAEPPHTESPRPSDDD